jgi:hypothetical protein
LLRQFSTGGGSNPLEHCGPFFQIEMENRLLPTNILQALKIGLEDRIRRFGKVAYRPVAATLRLKRPRITQRLEVARDLGLGNLENLSQMTNAKRPFHQEIEDAQAGGVAEAVIDINQIHAEQFSGLNMLSSEHSSFRILDAQSTPNGEAAALLWNTQDAWNGMEPRATFFLAHNQPADRLF